MNNNNFDHTLSFRHQIEDYYENHEKNILSTKDNLLIALPDYLFISKTE